MSITLLYIRTMQLKWITIILLQLAALPLFAQESSPAQSETDTKLIESLRERIATLQQQQTTLRNRLRQEERRTQQGEERLAAAGKTINSRNESIGRYVQMVADLNGRITQLKIDRREADDIHARVEAARDMALAKVARLTYERNLLTLTNIVRIYRVAPAETWATLIRSLDQAESGFQYSADSTASELKIVRHFGDQTEAWWVFDKTLDTILELTLQFRSHQFDRNRTLVIASSRLLQKTRYSNKPFEEQNDTEKIALYRDKTLKLLEGNLRTASDK